MLHVHVLIQPDSRRHDVNAAERRCGAKLWRHASQDGRVGHHALHALCAEREDHRINVFDHACFPAVLFQVVHRRRLFCRLVHFNFADKRRAHDFQSVFALQASHRGPDDDFGYTLRLDPAHVERVLVRQRVVIQQFHHDSRRKLLWWLEQPDEQRRANEIVHQSLTQSHANEQLVRSEPIVRLKRLLIAIQIQHRVQQADHRHPIAQRQSFKVIESRKHLSERARERHRIPKHRRRRLQPVRRPKRTRREFCERILFVDFHLSTQIGDIRIIFPKPACSRLERFPALRQRRRRARGVVLHVDERHVRPGFAQRFRGADAAPAGTDDDDFGYRIRAR
mmetsp:Transcript_1077/g.4550  ORF Transcript_1077/g.4550 Transcript_1077/m.4550 type:complete len:337 (+) Transcript_1077:700-1710(+)